MSICYLYIMDFLFQNNLDKIEGCYYMCTNFNIKIALINIMNTNYHTLDGLIHISQYMYFHEHNFSQNPKPIPAHTALLIVPHGRSL